MAFGNIGKAIAGQALEATKKNVMDAIAGPESKASDKTSAAGAPQPAAESVGGTILGQLQAMQRPLKEDQELVVLFQAGGETLRVLEIFVPNLQVFVLAGVDAEQNVTRAIVPVETAHLLCKIKKVAADAKPVRVSVLSPRPKPE
ncbi:MAG: hypothetical protein ABUS51_08900 [Acidobacteriota bacterium]